MSNPLLARRENLGIKLPEELRDIEILIHPFLDGYYGTADDLTAAAKRAQDKYGLEKAASMLESKRCAELWPAVEMAKAVEMGMVFNEGARKRPLAITADSKPALRRRAYSGSVLANLLFTVAPDMQLEFGDEGQLLSYKAPMVTVPFFFDLDEAKKRVSTYFMASAGTMMAMGRLEQSLLGHQLGASLSGAITKEEARLAIRNCGVVPSSEYSSYEVPDVYKMLWPIVHDASGLGVKLNKSASLGFPYCCKGTDAAGLNRCLEIVNFMLRDNGWKTNAATQYRRCMVSKPGFVLFQGKTKTDLYSKEKIDAAKMRFYLVMPAHLKLYLMRLTQPFEGSRMSLMTIHKLGLESFNPFGPPVEEMQDMVLKLHSAQKMGLTGIGSKLVVRSLDFQLWKRGYGYLHVGDDTVVVILARRYTATGEYYSQLIVFGTDQTSFDLTQDAEVCDEVDEELAAKMAEIDANSAGLWREIRKQRLTLVNQSGVALIRGTGTSGIVLQSLVNDCNQDVLMQRIMKDLTRDPLKREDGMIEYAITPQHIQDAVEKHGKAMKFTVRLEYLHSIKNRRVLGPFAADSPESKEHVTMELLSWALDSEELPAFEFLGCKITCRKRSPRAPQQGYPSMGNASWMPPEAPNLDVLVAPNIGRLGLSLLYPNKMWVDEGASGIDEFKLYDIIRLAGTLLCTGHLDLGLKHIRVRTETSDPFRRFTDVASDILLNEAKKLSKASPSARVGEMISNTTELLAENPFMGEGGFDDLKQIHTMDKLLDFLRNLPKIHHRVWNISPVSANTVLAERRPNVAREMPFDTVVGIGDSWADAMELEETNAAAVQSLLFDAVALPKGKLPYSDLRVVALRAFTRAAYGRFPPNKEVRQVLTHGGNPLDSGKESATQKRNKQKKRAKARARNDRTGYEAHEEASSRNLAALQLEEAAQAADEYERSSRRYFD